METFNSPAQFKDRKIGLVIFGILTVLMGGLSALAIPLVSYGQAMSAKGNSPASMGVMLPVIILYGGLALVLVWLGVGSIMARRWARALLLIFAWSWLLMGIFAVGTTAFMIPHLSEAAGKAVPTGQAAPTSGIMFIPVIVIGVMFVVIPGIWVFFYQSKDVKATCEERDPVMRWSDRCPLPVLAICVWLAVCVPLMLSGAFSYKGVLPVFGMFVSGPVGSALYVLLALTWGYSAWSLYKLEMRGWWLIVSTMCLTAISEAVTYLRHDTSEMYALAGYTHDQISQIQAMGYFQGHAAAWISAFALAPWIGYLLYVRKYLNQA